MIQSLRTLDAQTPEDIDMKYRPITLVVRKIQSAIYLGKGQSKDQDIVSGTQSLIKDKDIWYPHKYS